MTSKGMNRRQFLHSSGLAVAGAAVVAGGGIVVDPSGAWAMSTKVLDSDTAASLLIMARRLYPHDRLGDMYYAKVVEALDAAAAGDAGFAKLLADGVAELDAMYGVKFSELSLGNQYEALKQIEGSPFFGAVRGTTVWTLYADPLVWRAFGYEGSSAEYGGYLERGFDDIGWLPKN